MPHARHEAWSRNSALPRAQLKYFTHKSRKTRPLASALSYRLSFGGRFLPYSAESHELLSSTCRVGTCGAADKRGEGRRSG